MKIRIVCVVNIIVLPKMFYFFFIKIEKDKDWKSIKSFSNKIKLLFNKSSMHKISLIWKGKLYVIMDFIAERSLWL